MADMKLQIKHDHEERYYYPDILVTCSPTDNHRYFKNSPKLLIEILSSATERIDRIEKFSAYCSLKSLEEYLLVDQDKRHVEIYRRINQWQREVFQDSAQLHIHSLELFFNLDSIYENLSFNQ